MSDDRTWFTVACPIGDAMGDPHPGLYDFASRTLACERCRFSGSGPATSAIFAIAERVRVLDALFEEVQDVDPGRYREAVHRRERRCLASAS